MITTRYRQFADWFENHFNRPDFSIVLLAKFIAAALVVTVISDAPESWGFGYYFAKAGVGILALSTIFLPVRAAMILLLVLVISGRDFDTEVTASIWQSNVGFIRPSWIVFALVGVQLIKVRREIAIPRFSRYMIGWFAIVPVAAGLFYGDIGGERTLDQWVVDLKMPVMLLSVFILAGSILRR